MYSSQANGRTKETLNVSDVGPRFSSTKLAAAMIGCVLTLAALLLVAARPAQAQTETVLYNFCSQPNCSDGANPQSNLIADAAGNFYGTTVNGGLFGYGTVFELSPNGSGGWNETVLYSFTGGADGANPVAPVIFDSAGNLYGTTEYLGPSFSGSVFQLSPKEPNWKATVLFGEGGPDGVMMDAAGNLYGTVKSPDKYGAGVIELSPSDEGWTWQAIYNSYAYARLTMDASGNIFGVETKPLSVAGLTAFELWPNGAGGWNSSVIYRFGKNVNPQGAPVVIPYANTEMLFGTTESGGGKKQGTVYRLWGFTQTNGRWEEKNVYGFKGGTDGSAPYGGVIGDYLPLYGTTTAGGQYDDGIVFEIGAGFKEKVLWSFNGTDGAQPYGSLITDKSGNLYGTTTAGGSNNAGVVFEVTP